MENIIATLNTDKGNIKLELWPEIAPETVDNFVSLAKGERVLMAVNKVKT